jgi:type I restriction enzyme, R subunit
MTFISEADIEGLLLEQLAGLGYRCTTDAVIGPDGSAAEREAFSDVLLLGRLQAAIERLNPGIPSEARADALKQIIATVSPALIEENRRLHRLLVEGVPVEFYAADGTLRGDTVRLIDFDDPDGNDWLAVAQLTVVENGIHRRPDVVLFLNGLPVAVFELKNPGGEQATMAGAFNQLQTYKAQIPSLFRTNAALVISDGLTARIGSLTANLERFMPWRTTDGRTIAPKGEAEQRVLVAGAFERARFLALLRDFTVFGHSGNGLFKILAGYHQFHAVRRALHSTLRALAMREARPETLREDPEDYGLASVRDYRPGDRRIGVI